jgi:hypothetical protein
MRTAMVAGGAAAVAHHAGRRSAEAQAQEDAQNQQIASPAPTAAPATGPTQDNIQKLKELGELHAQGILTDEEFAAQKAKLL